MKFGLFYEHMLPKPWTEDSEHKLFHEALTQIELADKVGIDYLWVAEHHFLEEYSHMSAPELFLAACSQRTKNIRLGHGVMIMVPKFNHPARCAERIANLDVLSSGRVDWGTGESASAVELGGFEVPVADKHAMWREATEQAANMLAMTPYPGFQGKHFSMPCRNIVPKPMQKPHPPMWLACTKRETFQLAARLGMGALTFSFINPEEAGNWIQEYYSIIRSEQCVPIGHTVNANIAMVTGFSCHHDQLKAYRTGTEGMQFFNYGLLHYYVFGEHFPGNTNIWNNYEAAKKTMQARSAENSSAIGTPDQVDAYLTKMANLGLDQSILIHQFGKNQHNDICDSLNLFAEKVLPKFKAQEAEREYKKQQELRPFIEAALERKIKMKALKPGEIPSVKALGGIGELKAIGSNKKL